MQFSWETDPEPFLVRAERRQGRDASSLSDTERDAFFYSYFTEREGEPYEDVLENQYRSYLPYLKKKAREPFLDVGCGSGEFIRFLEKSGIRARGIDGDEREVQRATARGLDVICADALDFLEHTGDYFSGISFIEVIEHIPPDSLLAVIRAAERRLAEGGVLVVETINTRHPLSFHGFYIDPTHVRPVSDEYLTFLLQWVGLKDIKVVYTSPVWVPGTVLEDPKRIYYCYAVVGRKRTKA